MYYRRRPKSSLSEANCNTEAIAVFAAFFIHRSWVGANLDFSLISLRDVDRILGRFATGYPDAAAREKMKILAGCYILEVARMNFGGRYVWWKDRNMPVLECGFPDNCITIASFDKVLGRIENGDEDNIPFFFAGFVESMVRAKTERGLDVVYV